MKDGDYCVLALFRLLNKLRLAGLQRRSVSQVGNLFGNVSPIPRMAPRLVVTSLNIEYFIGVKYRDGDPALFPNEWT